MGTNAKKNPAAMKAALAATPETPAMLWAELCALRQKNASAADLRRVERAYQDAVVCHGERAKDDPAGPLFDLTVPPAPLYVGLLPAFPLDALPRWLREFIMAVAARIQCAVDLPAVAGLGMLSTALMRAVELECSTGPTHSYVNLYLAAVAPPTTGKTPAWRYMGGPFVALRHDVSKLAKIVRGLVDARLKQLKARESGLARAIGIAEEKSHTDEMPDLERRLKVLQKHLKTVYSAQARASLQLNITDATDAALVGLLAQNGEMLAMYTSEAASVFNQTAVSAKSGSLSMGAMVNGWDRTPLELARVGNQNTPKRIESISPLISPTLAIQPQVLSALSEIKGFGGQGLAQRFLFAMAPSMVGTRKAQKPPLNEMAAKAYAAHMGTIFQFGFGPLLASLASYATALEKGDDFTDEDLDDPEATTPGLSSGFAKAQKVGLSPAADQVLAAFYEKIEALMCPGQRLASSEPVTEWAGKLRDNVYRLAVLFHIAEAVGRGATALPTSSVSAEAAEQAVKLGWYFVEHGLAAFGVLSDGRQTQDAKAVLQGLPERGWITFKAAEVQRSFNRFHGRGGDIRPCLKLLEDCGYLVNIKVGQGDVYLVRPNLAEAIRLAEGGGVGGVGSVLASAPTSQKGNRGTSAGPGGPDGSRLGGVGSPSAGESVEGAGEAPGGCSSSVEGPLCDDCGELPAMVDSMRCDVCAQIANEIEPLEADAGGRLE